MGEYMSKTEVQDNPSLLRLMLQDSKNFSPLYRPGPYWEKRSISAVNELQKKGIVNFRSASNGASTSFGDNPVVDVRMISQGTLKSRSINFFLRRFPLANTFNAQVNLTSAYFAENCKWYSQHLTNSNRLEYLLKNYIIPQDNIRGGCETFIQIDKERISHLYLKILDTMDYMNSNSHLSESESFMEIGPGFGVNIHLLASNFSNIRKFVYIDIIPNLYIGTQYLKSFYGDAVIDYLETRNQKEISFADNHKLEIICISPNQIPNLRLAIDFFHNSHSFVEMTSEIVGNYANLVESLMSPKGQIYLVTYDGGDESTQKPNELTKHFTKTFSGHAFETLIPDGVDYHFISQR